MDLINGLHFGVLPFPWHPLVVSEVHHILKRKLNSFGDLSFLDDVIYSAKISVYPQLQMRGRGYRYTMHIEKSHSHYTHTTIIIAIFSQNIRIKSSAACEHQYNVTK